MGLRVLITNNTLAMRAGSELYVRDLALALLARGHTPIAYSTLLGDVAQELRVATIPVVDDLRLIAQPPDIIHGQHHLDTMTALLHFPQTPCVYFCHGWLPWEEAPPRFPRIQRYVAVDDTCRDRLMYEHAIPADDIEVLLNFVDLHRFCPRSQPLPPTPKRALVFSNAATVHTHLPAIQAACERLGVALDVVGQGSGHMCAQPEAMLGEYDLVFAKARAALEAMAVGAAVVLCDAVGAGPMVTTDNFARLRPLNFGIRTLQQPLSVEGFVRAMQQYNADDATAVSHRVRQTAGHDAVVDHVLRLYDLARQKAPSGTPADMYAEQQAAAMYMRGLVPRLKSVYTCMENLSQTQSSLRDMTQEHLITQQALGQTQQALEQTQQALEQTDQELGQTQQKLGQTQQALGQTQQALGQTQQELGQTQQVLHHTQSALRSAHQELSQAQQHAQYLQNGLHTAQAQTQHVQNLLTQTQQALTTVHQQVAHSQQMYQQAHRELHQLQQYVTWMQSSKFWKVRAVWIRVKRAMGLLVTERAWPSPLRRSSH